jgi:protein TonB
MAISAKSRSRHVLIGEPDAGGSLNDNNPGMLPGHELSDLRNVQRQPAGEAVIHYARFAQISSFPDHPEAAPAAPVAAPPMDAAVEKQEDEKAPVRRRVALAYASSLIFHAALVVALTIMLPRGPEEAVEEAGAVMSVVMYGDSDIDQTAAGDPAVTLQPEEIIAEAVAPDTVQPTEVAAVPPTDIQPTEVPLTETVEAAQTVQEVTRTSAETVTAAEPEILVSEIPAETSVVQPTATVVPEETPPDVEQMTAAIPEEMTQEVRPVEIQPTEARPIEAQPTTVPEEVKPVETAEVPPEPVQPEEAVTPTPKPKMQKPIEKPKPAEKKQTPKKIQLAAGSRGENAQDSAKGSVDGVKGVQWDQNSRSAGSNDGVGTAARANYGGKVRARIRRALREPNGVRGTATISLTIAGSGNLSSAVVARSSGVPEIDQAAADAVRRAAPFSPPPGGTSVTYTQSIQVGRD